MNIPHEAHEHPTHPNDPNRGVNVRVYLTVVAVAAVFIALILFVAVYSRGSKAVPAPNPSGSPSSSLSEPRGFSHKPSPLHPVVLQASVRHTPSRIKKAEESGE